MFGPSDNKKLRKSPERRAAACRLQRKLRSGEVIEETGKNEREGPGAKARWRSPVRGRLAGLKELSRGLRRGPRGRVRALRPAARTRIS